MTTSANSQLVNALLVREREYAEALDRIEDNIDPEALGATVMLGEAIELCRVLRRVVPALDLPTIHRAFGAPGDFGYETPIGDALSRLYRGEP